MSWIETCARGAGFRIAEVGIEQSPAALVILPEIMLTTYPSGFVSVVELGTGAGGLTFLLRMLLPYRFGIETFDEKPCPKHIRSICEQVGNTAFYMTDIFREKALVQKAMICRSSTVLICDAGSRKQEVEEFVGYLRPGDMLLVHEFRREPDSPVCWGLTDVTYEEIRAPLEVHGLSWHMQDVAELGGYGCFRKAKVDNGNTSVQS